MTSQKKKLLTGEVCTCLQERLGERGARRINGVEGDGLWYLGGLLPDAHALYTSSFFFLLKKFWYISIEHTGNS